MKVRHAPYWIDSFPARRRPAFPRLRSRIETRVVVVGGGLTGCACAAVLASARVPVVLLEADRVGGGATAGALGLVREDFDAHYGATVAAHGMREARTLWQGMRRSSLDFAAALRRLGIKCDLMAQDLLNVAPADRAAARQLKRDYELRRDAGLNHRWIAGPAVVREAALESAGAIRTSGSVLDPYRACLGLLSSAVTRGVNVFEHSAVRRVRARPKSVEVSTSAGMVTADSVVIATGAPVPDLRALRRHLHPRHSYGVVTEALPAAVRRAVGQRTAVIRDASQPPHFVRWLKNDRVFVEGAAQDPVPPRLAEAALRQRTGQLMYELSLLYPAISGTQPASSWSFAFDETVDGLPYIGPHRNFPRHYFALGAGRHGAGISWLAARLLLRHLAGEPAKGDELFGFARILSGH